MNFNFTVQWFYSSVKRRNVNHHTGKVTSQAASHRLVKERKKKIKLKLGTIRATKQHSPPVGGSSSQPASQSASNSCYNHKRIKSTIVLQWKLFGFVFEPTENLPFSPPLFVFVIAANVVLVVLIVVVVVFFNYFYKMIMPE